MKEDSYMDDMLDHVLNLMDEGEDISAEHLELLKNNQESSEFCADLLSIRAAARMADINNDTENRLSKLHAKLGINIHRRHTARIVAIIAAAAAMMAGFVFYINKPDTNNNGNLFTAVTDAGPVTISTTNGEKKPLKQQNTQEYTISVADYRKAMTKEENVERVMVNVPDGKTAHVNLPDGSVVYLHPGSKLRFPTAFVGDKRFVMLEGEAYFKVKHDETKPFIVQAEGVETTVLGTEFNVKGGVVTLISGKVKVQENSTRQSLIMSPGQQASLVDNRLTVAATDTLPYVYWRDGYLYYDNVEIADIMKNIGKTFNMSVQCRNTSVLHQRMRFIAERDKGVDAALEMMNRMGKVRVMRNNSQIIVE